MEKLLLSIEETAAAIGLGRSLTYEKVLAGEIVSIKCGRRRLVPRKAVEDWAERQVAEQVPVT